jgi:hypothetical protein
LKLFLHTATLHDKKYTIDKCIYYYIRLYWLKNEKIDNRKE